MEAGVIGGNVRRIRASKKLSQKELAERAGVSRVTMSRIEKGIYVPRAATLERLAVAMGASLGQLVTKVPELAEVRFRAIKRHHERDQIIADIAYRLQRYCELEDLVADHQRFELAGLWGQSGHDPRKLAALVRDKTALKEEPVRDICGFLEQIGVKVLRIRKATDAFFGLSVAPDSCGPAVVVNTWERISVERWIFSAVHEFGHLLMHLNAYDSSQTEEDPNEETEANSFAGHFLMPNEAFESEWTDTVGLPLVDRVFKVKRIFRVSYRTVLYRLVENGEADGSIWKVFQGRFRARYGRTLRKADEPAALAQDEFSVGVPVTRRANEPEQLSEMDFREDRLSRLVRSAFQAGQVSLGYAAEALGVSRSEMRALAREWAALDDEPKQ